MSNHLQLPEIEKEKEAKRIYYRQYQRLYRKRHGSRLRQYKTDWQYAKRNGLPLPKFSDYKDKREMKGGLSLPVRGGSSKYFELKTPHYKVYT